MSFRISIKTLIVLLISFSMGQNESSRISGFLTDMDTGEPIMYANIVLLDSPIGTASDNKGYYVLTNIPPKSYILKVMMMGYESIENTITLKSNDDIRFDFELNTNVLQGDEVLVSAERQRFENKVEVSRINLSIRDIKSAPAFAETDVFRTLQLLPGVSSSSDFSSSLVVRGGSPDENLIYLDGIEVYNPYHLGGVFSTFNAEAISDAEFLIGGFPAQYGNRISSVLNITSKEGNSKKGLFFNKKGIGEYWDVSNVQGDVSILSSKILAEGPIKNGSWMWSIRRTYLDQIAKLYYSVKDEAMNWKYFFWDSQGKLIYDLSPKNRLTFSSFYGRDAIGFQIGESTEIDFNWDWGNMTNSLQWRYVPNSKFLSTFSISNTNYEFDLDIMATVQDSLDESFQVNNIVFNEINDWTLKEKLDWFVSSKHTVSAGIELKNLKMEFKQQINDLVLLHQEQSPNIFSAFIQDKWQPTSRLMIQPGFRISKYSLHDEMYYEPRVGFKYLINEDLALKGAYGSYKQFLFTVNDEDEILNIVDFWQPILENYSAKSLQQYILGFEKWVGRNWFVSLEGFYKPYDNTLTLNPNNNPSKDNDDYIEGEGTAYGFEILLKKSSGLLTGWLGYSYLNMEQRYDFNDDGIIKESSGEIYSPKYDQPHGINIVLNYALGEKNSFGFTLSNSSGKPFTPTVGYTYTENSPGDIMISTDNPYSNLVELKGLKNSARYPSYFRIDVSWIKNIHPFGLDGKFKFQVINITNHFNTFLYNWDLENDKVTAVGMFPILPTIGFEFDL
ncbi:MAG: TonB-dependent receptor [Candidatus Marinimicrobia bacterium]|nr:TonB-dependent receptor [Candidatus Neomarinimicrobiota bacterium]